MSQVNARRSLLHGTALVGGLCAALWGGAAVAQVQTYSFDIPSEPLSVALRDYARVSGQQIIFTDDLVAGKHTAALHGTYSADDALAHLLTGTTLMVERSPTGAIMVRPKNAQAASSEAAETNAGQIETVTVTGTHLHNVEALAPLTTLTHDEMLNQGYTRLDEALQQLPQNSRDGASEESNFAGPNDNYNYSFGSGVNLRGLGPGATLTLLNGRRMPPTSFGASVDISTIPVSAIDRVEILTDGASAVYGSDAIGGVVNVITKKDYSGIETGVRLSGVSEGKDPNYGGYILGGFGWEGGNLLINFDHESDRRLLGENRRIEATAPKPDFLLPDQEKSSLFADLEQDVTSRLHFSSNALYAYRTYLWQNHATYFGQGVSRLSGSTRQLVASAQIDYRLSTEWTATVQAQYSREDDYGRSVVPYPGLFIIDSKSRYTYIVPSFDARIDGTVFELPGGAVQLALGVQGRHESFRSSSYYAPPFVDQSHVSPPGTRSVFSAYGEILVPIVGNTNAVPLVQKLFVDVTGRYDRYSDFGSTFNPKFSVKWDLSDEISLNSSYAKSFRAPLFFETGTGLSRYGYVVDATDPASPTGTTTTLLIDGANPDLKPERATSLAGTIKYQPEIVPGLTTQLSYFDINYTRRIERLIDQGFYTNVIVDAAELGPFVNLSPTLAQVNAALATIPVTNISSQVGPFTPADIKAIAEIGYVNAASSVARGFDISVRYDRDEEFGHIYLDATGTLFTNYNEQVTPTSANFNIANTAYNPLRFRAKTNVGWSNQRWTANVRLNYSNAYHNPGDPTCQNVLGCPIASWTTVDASISYTTPDDDDTYWGRGIRVGLDVTNLFDNAPPFVRNPNNPALFYDTVNASALQRAFALTLTKKW